VRASLTASGAVLAALVLTGGACGKGPPASVSVDRRIPYTATAELDVYRPPGRRGLPVIVMLHGCCGSRDNLSPLASRLAEEGAVIFNASWRGTDSDAGGYPGAYEEAACAVRFARATAPAHGGDPRRVTLVGWSDGALVAGVVADAGDDFAHGCRGEAAGATPDSFVGLGGFFGWAPAGDGSIDATYVNERTVRFFGGTPPDAATAWAAGNPYTHLGRNPRVPIRLVVGSDDPLLVDDQCFALAALAVGHPVSLNIAEGAGHQTVIAPQYPEGALAVRQILLAANGVDPAPGAVPPGHPFPCPGVRSGGSR